MSASGTRSSNIEHLIFVFCNMSFYEENLSNSPVSDKTVWEGLVRTTEKWFQWVKSWAVSKVKGSQ